MFGPNVQIYTATHPIEISRRRAGSELAYPITVLDLRYCNDCRLVMIVGLGGMRPYWRVLLLGRDVSSAQVVL